MKLTRKYTAQCAHALTAGVPNGHPCRRLHGHRYEIEITIEGDIAGDGMVFEYSYLDALVENILNKIDHHDLNTLEKRLEKIRQHPRGVNLPDATAFSANPTAELLTAWLVSAVRQELPKRLSVARMVVRENARSAVEWP